MPKYLIEGSEDGGLFAETIEADNDEDAEKQAIARLCEAWGHTQTDDTTLDDLGDSASVTEYSHDDYVRDEASIMFQLLHDIAACGRDDDGDILIPADEHRVNTIADRIDEVLGRIHKGAGS